ncbi:MAG: DUF305 domain-containing protein, partial [Pseudomonadota bacterium]
QGGMSIIDFTNTREPVEIAYFDRGPVDAEHLVLGGYWSTYYYNGLIYGTEILRGLDVFEPLPSEYLSEAEIAAAALANDDDVFNPQQQLVLDWPAAPVVAQAYADQLLRADDAKATVGKAVHELMKLASVAIESGRSDRTLARRLNAMADLAEDTPDMVDGLADVLRRIAKQLR